MVRLLSEAATQTVIDKPGITVTEEAAAELKSNSADLVAKLETLKASVKYDEA